MSTAIIKDVVFEIKKNNNFIEAAKLMKLHNISFQLLITYTFKLSYLEIAKLGDAVLSIK